MMILLARLDKNKMELEDIGVKGRIKKALYYLVEMPMMVFDRLTVRARDRMPRSIKNAMPFLSCREHYFHNLSVECKVGRKYEHPGLMKKVCRYYRSRGLCGRYSDGKS